VTLNQAQQYRAIGDAKHALLDLYHVLLHNGSTHEGFENLVVPWSTRTPSANCPPPHAWAAAKTALFIRNMMVCEYGGQTGIDAGKRDLYLYSLISPSWIKPGKKTTIRNAPTEMGLVSSSLTFIDGGATLTVKSAFHHPPRYVVFRVPYSVKFISMTSDASGAFEENGLLFFTSDVTRASIKWRQRPGVHDNNYQDILKGYRGEFDFIVKDGNYDPAGAGKPFLLTDEKNHPAEPLSFDLVRRAFVKEYSRRFTAYKARGGKPYPVEPPPLLTAEQRRAAFARRFGKPISKISRIDPPVHGIAVGKPVTASASLKTYQPALAVDGVCDNLQSSWQCDPYPAWLRIDLEKPTKLNRIHVFPYWGSNRFYRYVVEVSEKGKTWRRVADMSKNKAPASPKGDDHRFDPVTARYVRVNMLHHNLNRGVHLVEVRVFDTK
jgi:hypothetical protein